MSPTLLLVGSSALLGLLIGSFLNVVIWRVPRGESLVRPASHCPRCNRDVAPRDNIPLLSWLLLRGRCRHCGEPISIRYPLVELLTAGVFATFAASVGFHASLVAFLYLGAMGVALALIDIDVKRLPNAIVLPSYAVAAVLLTGAAAVDDHWHGLMRAVIAGVVLRLCFSVMARFGGMGWGDVRLAGILGLYLGWLGWGAVVVGGFAGFFLGGLGGLLLIGLRRAGRKTMIPFGPYMLLGALLGILAGNQLADAYLNRLGA